MKYHKVTQFLGKLGLTIELESFPNAIRKGLSAFFREKSIEFNLTLNPFLLDNLILWLKVFV
ncbi:MAG: hypothetical protein COA42_22075 [Alteromonadaceae bacterium]|nr:MAG: hypothetical protein COA42_22075 [Alteromonadaceae bacterium]